MAYHRAFERAAALYAERRFEETIPLLEELVARQPGELVLIAEGMPHVTSLVFGEGRFDSDRAAGAMTQVPGSQLPPEERLVESRLRRTLASGDSSQRTLMIFHSPLTRPRCM